ncbi:hypothetical protein [Streptomyces sp. H34-S4]|uniref:hypothetical protein n=1 Tax=Streptomyces sp. H34-S4 TaxID=2996463 RepID=UPI00226E6848|nr:hypothetical protein [Streptomyces sp. H34-S4]MCY0935160.1 hypothetical protein [Streptomyces sp. H34-S4]
MAKTPERDGADYMGSETTVAIYNALTHDQRATITAAVDKATKGKKTGKLGVCRLRGGISVAYQVEQDHVRLLGIYGAGTRSTTGVPYAGADMYKDDRGRWHNRNRHEE